MKDLILLIKPASGLCDMRCSYCFYHDEVKGIYSGGNTMHLMSLATLEQTVKNAFSSAENKCSFIFQGGEPTLQELAFYEEFERLVCRYNVDNIEVERFIQTNGVSITESHAEFFLKNDYYVGVSIDGDREQHDRYRKKANGEGTHKRVTESIKLLLDYGVDVSALVTVTENNAVNGAKIYRYIRSLGVKKIQFTKYISTENEVYLTSESYGRFLKEAFWEYLNDMIKGVEVSVREFDDLIRLCAGERSSICGGEGICRCALTVEVDGSVYPCDFYVGEKYLLGNVYDNRLSELYSGHNLRSFIERSKQLPEVCKSCKYLKLCGNGCYRYRDDNGKYLFCESYKAFFDTVIPYLTQIANRIKQRLR